MKFLLSILNNTSVEEYLTLFWYWLVLHYNSPSVVFWWQLSAMSAPKILFTCSSNMCMLGVYMCTCGYNYICVARRSRIRFVCVCVCVYSLHELCDWLKEEEGTHTLSKSEVLIGWSFTLVNGTMATFQFYAKLQNEYIFYRTIARNVEYVPVKPVLLSF